MGGDNGSDASLQGWSKGYVEFIWDAHERTLTPWASANGLTWRAGNKLDTSAWNSYFKSYDADPTGDHDGCWVTVSNFQEGPATMLLQGMSVSLPAHRSRRPPEHPTSRARLRAKQSR
jgi:hypothetical protein